MNKICPWIPAIVKRVSNRQNIISLEIKIQIKEKYFSSFNRSKSKMNYGKEIGTSSTSWISTSRKSKFFPCPKSNPGQCQFQDTLRQENSSLLPRRKYKNKFHWPCRRVRTADFRKYCRTVYPRGWNFQKFFLGQLKYSNNRTACPKLSSKYSRSCWSSYRRRIDGTTWALDIQSWRGSKTQVRKRPISRRWAVSRATWVNFIFSFVFENEQVRFQVTVTIPGGKRYFFFVDFR